MARKLRINQVGFYHVINRGVERRDVYLDDEDRLYFLSIVEQTGRLYLFEVHSFCLMNNHYHLLLETKSNNLSLIMHQINFKYSIYFNSRYKRVGHLWQGRFKSWYVYDDKYLAVLVKYIEFNPIKSGIVKKIGEYPWAMSSNNVNSTVFNFALLEQVDLKTDFSNCDAKKLNNFIGAKIKLKDSRVVKVEKKLLASYFVMDASKFKREVGIADALTDGYSQVEVGKFLGLSNVSISKIYKNYKEKAQLFNRLRDAGVFWSYSKEINYKHAGDILFIEYLLKYGDFADIVTGFKLFGKRMIRQVWLSKVATNRQFIKLNVMLAKVFFEMDVESSYFAGLEGKRYEKLRLLTS